MILLVPYGIAIAIGPHFPPDYSSWTPTERLVGLFPGFLANGLQGAIGTAGAVLVGVLPLSALGVLTGGWHPLTVLRQREAARKATREGSDKELEPAAGGGTGGLF